MKRAHARDPRFAGGPTARPLRGAAVRAVRATRIPPAAPMLTALLLTALLLGCPLEARSQRQPTPEQLQQMESKLSTLSPADRVRVLEALQQSRAGTAADSTAAASEQLPINDTLAPRLIGTADSTRAQAAPMPAPASAPAKLPRFGRDLFRAIPATFAPVTYGPVSPEYRLGPGDELIVEVWGEVTYRDRHLVDRRGTILLRDAGALTVAGLTLEEVQREVNQRLARVLSGVKPKGGGSTFADVSLGRLRAIRVFVVGEAMRPGGYEVSSVSTIFQALYAAGGPSDIGSLRAVRLIRENREVARLDLYEYLIEGTRRGDESLRDGDSVFIPVADRTVAVSGEVRRPARFELLEGEGLSDALRFAGGLLPSARTDVAHLHRILPPQLRAAGQLPRVELDLPLQAQLDGQTQAVPLVDGDEIEVRPVSDLREGYVSVTGSVVRPGRYAYVAGMKLGDLLERAQGVWKDALLDRALLVRTRSDYSKESFEIPLGKVLAGEAPQELAPMDSLCVFSLREMQDRHRVEIHGEVHKPAIYEFYEGMSLRDLILLAGGLNDQAEALSAEISRVQTTQAASVDTLAEILHVPLGRDFTTLESRPFLLQNHDNVFIRRLPYWELQRNVLVGGEVKFPGVYTLQQRDERLSSVLQRCGGLLPTAFPPGFRINRPTGSVGNIGLDLQRALEHPGGPDDIILVAGDQITIPPQPLSVKVIGRVGFPTSVVYAQGKGVGHYVDRAGGFADHADKGRTQIIYPNGLSRTVRRFWWDPPVQPGSTIYVPDEDRHGGVDWGDVLVKTTTVLSSLATIYLVIDRTRN
jgi:polysaccharide export outer membrane protein